MHCASPRLPPRSKKLPRGRLGQNPKFSQTSASLPTPSLSAGRNKLQGCIQHYSGCTKRDSGGLSSPQAVRGVGVKVLAAWALRIGQRLSHARQLVAPLEGHARKGLKALPRSNEQETAPQTPRCHCTRAETSRAADREDGAGAGSPEGLQPVGGAHTGTGEE